MSDKAADLSAELNREVIRRQAAESERDAARARLEAALNAGEVAIWTWDIPNDLVLGDTNLRKLFNVVDASPDGDPLAVYTRGIHEEDRARVEREIQSALVMHREYEAEFRVVQGDGTERWVIARGRGTYDDAGNPLGLPGVVLDVTTRKQAEKALQESEERFRRVADMIPQLIWSTLPDGYHDYYNARWFDYTGLTYEDTQGEKWNEVLHPDDQQRAWGVWRHSLETGEPYEIEYRFKRYDGVYRWFIGRALPVRDSEGNIQRWFGTCTDVDDQKRIEETLRVQREEIAGLNARLQRAMVETHHRVKNNLQLMAAMIEMQRGPESEAVPQKVLERLGENIRALSLIHDLLTQEAREQRGGQTLSAQDLLSRLLTVLGETVRGRKFDAVLEDVPLSPKYATSLALIANELISNALKHGSGDVTIHFQMSGDVARLEVGDDGPGFPDGFDPVEKSNTGLELIDNIVRYDFQGDIQFENREQGGGIVRVLLPVPGAK